jgi:hypothetical protein
MLWTPAIAGWAQRMFVIHFVPERFFPTTRIG